MNPQALLKGYDPKKLTIATLGGHSALEICLGAKKQGLRTCVVAQKGREKTFTQYLKSNAKAKTGCVDEVILVDKFADILKPKVQEQLRKLNALLVHSRYFWVYFDDPEKVEKDLHVPILGTRELPRLEERDQKPNQYDVLKDAGIHAPKIFTNPDQIDRLTVTKVASAHRGYERANFYAGNSKEWEETAETAIDGGDITEAGLKKAVIEEYISGAQINFNFFYSPLEQRLEMLGTDIRRQTNLDGILRIPQVENITWELPIYYIEAGHVAATVKESTLEKAYEIGERFLKACKKYNPRGIIGPFALQGALDTDGKQEDLVIFDVSFRMPGSPGITATPYSSYLFGRPVSLGERLAMEVNAAAKKGKLEEIVS